jgi:hypothetical protein
VLRAPEEQGRQVGRSAAHDVTGISYALIDKSAQDKLPLAMMGYGRTDAVDGSVFPYAFPLVTTYQMQASAIVKFIKDKNGGSLAGKKIVYLYHDSAYGKEAIIAMDAESKLNKFPWCRFRWPTRATSKVPNGCDSPGAARLRRVLGLGRDEPDRAQGGPESRLPA